MINSKKMKEFKDNVEAEYQAVKESSDDVAATVNVDSPFVVVTVLKFKSQGGAKEYEDAFAILAESRREFASTYLLTKVRDEKGEDEQPEYIEFIVFRNSEAFRQHRLTVTEGTSQMKQAMNEHVVLDAVTINAFGQIDDQERAVLNMMGANIFEHSAGYVNLEADGNINPVPVLSRFKCQSQEDVDNYCRAFATTASKMHDYASTYVLTKDPNDDDGLGMSEILIYRSADAFVNHAKLDVIKNELGPALAKYLVQDSVRVTVIGQPPGSEVEQTLKAVNAAYTDLQAGFIS